MSQYNYLKLIVAPLALTITGTFMLCDLGMTISPLARFFVVFLFAIISLQSVPAVLTLAGIVKKVAAKKDFSVEQQFSRNGDKTMKARKVLIADRDSASRKKLVSFFEDSHFEVESTASAAYAIARIVQKHEPIVILGDSFEEKIASADVIALMRKCNKNLRIILVSDDSSLDTLQRIREDGIFYHALKPHNQEDNEELRSVVECAVEGFQPAML